LHRGFGITEDLRQLAGANPTLLVHASNFICRNQPPLTSPGAEFVGFDRSVFFSLHPDNPFVSHLAPLLVIPPKD
jgi:hypothetical protein